MSTFAFAVVLALAGEPAADTTAAPPPTSTPTSSLPPAPGQKAYVRSDEVQALLAPRGTRELVLSDAMTNASHHQPQLLQARATTAAAWARADEARAPLLPQLSGVASYQRTTANYVPRPGAVPSTIAGASGSAVAVSNSINSYNYYNFGLTLSQFVWDFGVTTDRWKASKVTADSTHLTELTTLATVTLSVRSAYFTARTDRELADVARETLVNQEKHLQQIEGGVRVGARPLIDLYQGRTNLANAVSALITAENNYATAKAQLALSAGLDGPPTFEIPADEIAPVQGEEKTTDDLLDEAMKARPDLLALDAQIRAQRLTLSSAKGAYGPSIGAQMNLTDAGTDVGNLAWNWSVTGTATWSLFSGLLTYSQVKEQRATLTAIEAQRDGMKQQVRFDVEQARLAVNAAKASTRATNEALVNSRAQLQLAEGRYASGLGNIIELSDAQVAVTTAAGQVAQSELNLAIARAQLLKALGRT